MSASPQGFDHFRRGEPINVQPGAVSSGGFDYYRRGEPLATVDGAIPQTLTATVAIVDVTVPAATLAASITLSAASAIVTVTVPTATLSAETTLSADSAVVVVTVPQADIVAMAAPSTEGSGGHWIWFKHLLEIFRRGSAKMQQQALTCESSGTVGTVNIGGSMALVLNSPRIEWTGNVISPITAEAGELNTRTLRLSSDGTKMEQPSRELIEALMLVDF